MAFSCIKGIKAECDGCNDCYPKVFAIDELGREIYEGESYYDFDGELVTEDSLKEWAEKYRKTAERENDF